MLGMQTQPYLQATEAVLPPMGLAKDETTIYTELAQACRKPVFGSRLFQGCLRLSQRVNQWLNGNDNSVPQKFWLNVLLRVCGQKGFKAHLGHGRQQRPNGGGEFLGQRVYTDTGKVALAPKTA